MTTCEECLEPTYACHCQCIRRSSLPRLPEFWIPGTFEHGLTGTDSMPGHWCVTGTHQIDDDPATREIYGWYFDEEEAIHHAALLNIAYPQPQPESH